MHIITSHCLESSRELSDALNEAGVKCDVVDIRNQPYEYLRGTVFAYGTSAHTYAADKRYNKSNAVKNCVDKVTTFKAFKASGVPTVEYVTNRQKVPKHWETIVCRKEVSGRKAEGFQLVEQGDDLPDWELFTEYFYYVREYRVVVFMGQAFVYYKREVWDPKEKYTNHEFIFQKPRRAPYKIHVNITRDAIKAAKALGIDYVGFDIVVNSRGAYRFLEANSGAILCEEVKAAIINHFKGK